MNGCLYDVPENILLEGNTLPKSSYYDTILLSVQPVKGETRKMRERYWSFFSEIKYKSFYYQYFQAFFSRINWGLSAILSLTTLSCIAAWDMWKSHPVLWGALICFSQVVQALFPKLPYNDLLISTKFMISALDKLILSVEHDWLFIECHSLSDDDILQLLEKHQNEYSRLVDQFFSGTYLPTIKWCERKADEETRVFFSVAYNIKSKEE